MYILDIEASGLGPDSYPIEIAWCSLDGEQSWSTLINPDSAGGWEDWDDYAEEAIHGIARDQLLSEGQDVVTVARELEQRLGGEDVFSDAVPFDGFWLRRLFGAVGRQNPVRVQPLETIFCSRYAVELGSAIAAFEPPHRALADCRGLAEVVRSVVGQQ
jgi:DNA polymerase III epsilon subunit-like protein